MKKTLAISLLAALPLATSPTLAQANMAGFIGFQLGATSISTSPDVDADTATSFGIKGGVYLNQLRLYVDATATSWDDADKFSFTGNADYILPLTQQAGLFVGGHFGHVSMEMDEVWIEDETGLIYGAQAGALFNLSGSLRASGLEIEIGARYSQSNLDWFNGEIELDDTTRVYAGLNYRF